MPTEKRKKAGSRRPGARSGVYGLTYWAGGYYLSPSQFGSYTTAQETAGSTAGGEVTSTGSTGGDAGGAT